MVGLPLPAGLLPVELTLGPPGAAEPLAEPQALMTMARIAAPAPIMSVFMVPSLWLAPLSVNHPAGSSVKWLSLDPPRK